MRQAHAHRRTCPFRMQTSAATACFSENNNSLLHMSRGKDSTACESNHPGNMHLVRRVHAQHFQNQAKICISHQPKQGEEVGCTLPVALSPPLAWRQTSYTRPLLH
jgi:hypothetical protein